MTINFKYKLSRLFAFVICCFLNYAIEAQCKGCGTTIVNNSISSYTISKGQNICVASGLTYTGSLVLDGGTLCNEGTINNVSFLGGIFNNYGTFKQPSLNVSMTRSVTINNYSSPTFSASNTVTSSPSSPVSFSNCITLTKTIGAGYSNSFGDHIYFRFEEENNPASGSNLNYTLLTDLNVPVGSQLSHVRQIGNNQYSLDLGVLGLTLGKYYRLKVSNNKNEVWYMRFKYYKYE